ncbi:proteoglycan 4-like [Battus philenor]|uniref:proteoglycan 4-like n=1 Tax=Battus philenor TaxID=42288 RepID=UPI0035D0960D
MLVGMIGLVLGVMEVAGGPVDCRTACAKCSGDGEQLTLQEVYCGMCHECRERRRDWVRARRRPPRRRAATLSEREFSYEEFEECPTPPPCTDADEPEQLKSTASSTTTTTTTTTTTPSTTTKKQCPEVPDCRPRKKRPRPCCIPMCPYPTHPFCPTEITPQKMTATLTTPSTTKDYFYVHIGVPKALLNN